ncbi:MAG: WbqC family protein [Candidatus Omnitrophica bacterium]|nr:WbqC family protein [Candidatus Omnitrophota bacterium]
MSEIEDVYFKKWDKLLDLNVELIRLLAKKLSVKTPCVFSSEFNIKSTKTQRILETCKFLNANELYDSMAALNFLNLFLFKKENISVKFQNDIHPVYNQVYKPFIPYMSALD